VSWAAGLGLGAPPRADDLDAVLHEERALVAGERRTSPVEAAEVPDGAMILEPDGPWLVAAGALLRWTPGGYTTRRVPPAGRLRVLTPPSAVAALRAGYRARLHPSAEPR
jgi:hypothetical protein